MEQFGPTAALFHIKGKEGRSQQFALCDDGTLRHFARIGRSLLRHPLHRTLHRRRRIGISVGKQLPGTPYIFTFQTGQKQCNLLFAAACRRERRYSLQGVLPDIADSTVTDAPSRTMMSATLLILAALPTEVPPNFKTFIILFRFIH